MTEREQRLQEIREQIQVQRDLPLDVYPDLADVEWLLNLIEEIGPLAEIGRQQIARSIVAAEKAAGNEITFEEAYEGATLLSAKDIAEL